MFKNHVVDGLPGGRWSRILTMTGLAAIVSGCGGAGGPGGPLLAGDQGLLGVNARTDGGMAAIVLIATDGEETTDNALTVSDGSYSFVAADGFVGGEASETAGTGILTEIDLPGTYETRLFDGFYDTGTDAFGVFYGILGPDTATAPLSGVATFNGDAVAQVDSGGVRSDLGTGAALVTADYAARRVDAVLGGFTGVIDTVNLTGMDISGNRFGGGAISFEKAGLPTDPTGAGTVDSTSGIFAGSVLGNPAEVAGLFHATGGSGTVAGAFVAE